jgi:hypothetical protein
MARRLLATVKNHEAHRCAKVYRDTILKQYVVTFINEDPPPELRTGSREEAYTAAWGFAWPIDPRQGSVPT